MHEIYYQLPSIKWNIVPIWGLLLLEKMNLHFYACLNICTAESEKAFRNIGNERHLLDVCYIDNIMTSMTWTDANVYKNSFLPASNDTHFKVDVCYLQALYYHYSSKYCILSFMLLFSIFCNNLVFVHYIDMRVLSLTILIN